MMDSMISFQPPEGSVVYCDYSGFKIPEMIKKASGHCDEEAPAKPEAGYRRADQLKRA